MPSNLSSSGATFPTQTAPAQGEARTAASVATPLQNATDRSQYLKRRLDLIQTEDEGVRRLRVVASVAALQAVTDHVDGTIIEVADVGLYRFDGASALSQLLPRIVQPTDIPMGNGRWVMLAPGYGMLDVANGIPALDTNGLIPTARLAAASAGRIQGSEIKNGLVDFQTKYYATAPTTPSITWIDLETPTFIVAAKNGDKLKVTASLFAKNDANTDADHAEVRLVTVSPSSVVTMVPGTFYRTGKSAFTTIFGFAGINADGNWQLKLQYQVGTTGVGTAQVTVVTIGSELYRP